MKIRCRFGWHHWTRWTEPEQREFTRVVRQHGFVLDERQVFHYVQSRECMDCTLVQRRTVLLDKEED